MSFRWFRKYEKPFLWAAVVVSVGVFVVFSGMGNLRQLIGGRNADLFAAAAPLAGSVMPYMRPGTKNKRETPLSDYLGLMEGVLPNLMHVPYWIAHSADDRNEASHPDDLATGWLRKLQVLHPGRYEFVYDRVDGNGHALPPKGVGPILEWMAAKRRARAS